MRYIVILTAADNYYDEFFLSAYKDIPCVYTHKPHQQAIPMSTYISVQNTVFYLITTHTPINTQSSNSTDLNYIQCTFVYFFIKAYVVGTHLNCINKSMQFK